MAQPKKTIMQYEKESIRKGSCLIHSANGIARRIYQLRHGSILPKVLVCHTCDDPFCIEDRHHFLGTKKDNAIDSVKKGRHSCFKNCAKPGKRHPFFGEHQSLSAKKKIGKASKKMWASRSKKERDLIAIKVWKNRSKEQRRRSALKGWKARRENR